MNSAIRTFFIFTALLANNGLLFGMQKKTTSDGKYTYYVEANGKPSLNLPTRTWEDADREEVFRQIALEREEEAVIAQQKAFTLASQAALAKPTITITNNGLIPFIAQIETIKNSGDRPIMTTTEKLGEPVSIPTKTQRKLLVFSCPTETYLTLRTCNKQVVRYPLKSALGISEEETLSGEKMLTITIYDDSDGCISTSFTNEKYDFFLLGEPATPVTSLKNKSLDNESDTSGDTVPLSIDSPVTSPQAKSEHYQGDI